MFITKSVIKLTSLPTVFVVLLTFLSGCSATESDVGMWDDNEPIKFLVADEDEGITRGKYETAKDFTEYAINSFLSSDGRPYVLNSEQTKLGDGSWTSSRTISFRGKIALDFYAMKPGFVRDDVKDLTMTAQEKSFTHTIPNTNAKQTDFMISSLLNKTKESTGGTLLFTFKHLFSYLRFQGKVSKEGLNVKIRSITLHNIKSTGKFTFSTTKEKDGSWELLDGLDNYTFLLPEEKDLTSKNAMLHTTDSLLFVMPQAPTIFSLSENGSFADADVDGNEKAYLEVECRLWTLEDDGNGGTTPKYVGCEADTWAKVYYPMASTTTWSSSRAPFAGLYNVVIDFTGGYAYDGEDFLKKHTSGSMQMTSMEPVQTFLVTTPWADDTTNSATFEM